MAQRAEAAPNPHSGTNDVDRSKDVGRPRPVRPRLGHATRYATDPAALRKAIKKAGTVSLDLETKGLHPHATEDAAIGAIIARANDQTFILRELPAWWPKMLADGSIRKILHNAKFDLMWMIDFCPDLENGQPVVRNVHDTMIKSQLVNRYRTRTGAAKAGRPEAWVPNDLATCLDRYLGVVIDKAIDHEVTDWTGEWSDDMIAYMLEDIEYLEPLNDVLDRKLQESGQERAAAIEMDVIFGMAWMTLNGMLIDRSLWEETIAEWREQHSHLLWHLQKMWPGVQNFNSTQQIQKASAAVVGGQLRSTKKAILKQLASEHPPVQALLDQRKLSTRLKNWGPTFLRLFVCASCERLHPSWNQIGAETSRCSCSKPNAQQFPRNPEFRRMIVASPGHLLVAADYSAIEVVCAAVLSRDKNLLEACRTGDPHLATARMIANDDTITKKDPRRQDAKIANFGLLFGGGAAGLQAQARDLFDVNYTLEECQQIINRYFKLYYGMKRMRNEAYDLLQTGPESIELYNEIGFMRVLEGHNRKPTSILNTKIQSLAGYGIKSSFRYLRETRLLPFLIGQIHDELLFEFPEDFAEEGGKRAKACMLRGMFDVLGKNAPVHVDVEIGHSWL